MVTQEVQRWSSRSYAPLPH